MKKMNNKKTIAIASIALASVCLIGVGFSSWIIQNVSTEATGNITVTVAGTSNQLVTIENVTLVDGSIYLDAAEGDDVAPIKHLSDGAGIVEDLDLQFTFEVAKSQIADFNGVHYRLVTKDSALSTYFKDKDNEAYVVMPGAFTDESDEGAGYYPLVLDSTFDSNGNIASATTYLKATQSSTTVVLPDSESKHNIKVTTALDGENYKFTVDLSLGWGATFGNVNPSRWGEGKSDTLDDNFATAEAVIAAIEDIKDKINGKAFTIELSHFPGKVATI